MKDLFTLRDKVIVITGGAGFLGRYHVDAIAAYGGTPVILDLSQKKIDEFASEINSTYKVNSYGYEVDITDEKSVENICKEIRKKSKKISVLINNAANNPKVDNSNSLVNSSRLESFPRELWDKDIAVGLTGSFFCSKYFGFEIMKSGGGSIINVSSDLGIIAPDQRLYGKDGVDESLQNVKPVTYSAVKTGLIGLTRYLATYWADKNVRCNAICPGGIFNNQGEEFLSRINRLIPMGRMGKPEELQGIIVYLSSDASSYMNGSIIVIDGGRSCW
jgi:NAD(P)-dependent dehydrogenase (short-subunit alcohol dehydrogenase family)